MIVPVRLGTNRLYCLRLLGSYTESETNLESSDTMGTLFSVVAESVYRAADCK